MKRVFYLLFILFLLVFCLTNLFGCKSYESRCPVYPIAGAEVAEELETAGDMPHFYNWLGRIEKLKQELRVCGG